MSNPNLQAVPGSHSPAPPRPDVARTFPERKRGWTWTRVLAGLGVGTVGGLIWITASVVGGVNSATGQPIGAASVGVRIGFVLMVLGPLVGWIALPVATLRNRWVKWPVLLGCSLFAALVLAAAATLKLR